MFFWIVYKIHIFMQCARQNPYEFFLHEYVNFVHGTEKPYRSLSIKIYIFMQCAPKSFSRISRLDSMAKCVNFSHIWPCCKVNSDQPSATGVSTRYRPFALKYTLKFPLFTKLLPKVYQTIPGVYQKWRKFKYSCTARTLCSISTDTGSYY